MHESASMDLEPGRPERLAAGGWIERRSFLGLAAASLGTARLPATRRSAFELPPDAQLSFEEFLTEVVPVARELVRDGSRAGEDRYLYTLASFAVRLVDVPIPELLEKGTGGEPRTFIGANPGGDPFVVLHWRMEPGARIGLHAHTYGNVVTLGLEGAARIQNFEMVGERDFEARGPFEVRKCTEQILGPGEINLVPLSHGYCHGFLAGPQGARGLDITTRIQPKRSAPLLEVSPRPIDEEAAIYEGRWRFE